MRASNTRAASAMMRATTSVIEQLEQRRLMSAGDLDTTFAGGFRVDDRIPGQDEDARAIAVQSSGAIVVLATDGGSTASLYRYNSDGSTDTSFGADGDGKTTIELGDNQRLNALTLQGDNILVAGKVDGMGGSDFVVAKYSPNGQLDTSFDGDGMQEVNFTINSSASADEARGLAVSGGKVIVAGDGGFGGGVSYGTVAQLDANTGLIDWSSANYTNSGFNTRGVAVKGNGQVVVAGFSSDSSTWAVEQFNSNGSRDNGFGANGVSVLGFGGQASAVAIDGQNNIVLGGNSGSDPAVARISGVSGAADTSFDSDGVAKVTFQADQLDGEIRGVAVQADGKIIAGGYVATLPNGHYQAGVARLNANGSMDSDFGTDGATLIPAGSPADDDAFGEAIALQADGKVLLSGSLFDGNSFEVNALIARFEGDGVVTPPTNTPPSASNDSYSTNEDTQLVVAAPGVLGNDSDADLNPITAILVSGPSHGSLTLNSNGSFTYTPDGNYHGTDSFTYKANDGQADGNVASVSLTVNTVNDVPVASNDAYGTNEDTPLTISGPGVLSNDSDIDGDALSAVLVSGPSHGSLTLNANGSFTYTPATNYHGSDSFTYKANDGQADSNVATVSLTVNSVNDAPAASNDAFGTNEDETLTIPGPGVLANDTDDDGDALSALQVSGPSHGSLSLNADGSFTYTPAANYNGIDTFTYRASDGTAQSSLATVTITVAAVNDAPVATNDSYATNEDTSLTIVAPGVLGNDSDIDSPALTSSVTTNPSHGSLTLNSDGSFTYVPNAGYHGADSFTYKASDGSASSNTATVSINVVHVNHAPVAANDSYNMNAGATLTVAAPGVLGNDVDSDGDSLSTVLVTNAAHGTLTLNPNGSFSYTPAVGYSGNDTFQYRATDGTGQSNIATATININAVNHAPVAHAGTYAAVNENQTMTLNGGSSTDPDGDALSYAWDLDNDGQFDDAFTQTVAFSKDLPGTYPVKLRVSDGQATSSDTITVTFNDVAPTANAGPNKAAVRYEAVNFTGSGASTSDSISSLQWDFNYNGTTFNAQASGANVSKTYTAAGTYTVSLKVTDDDGQSKIATTTVTVTAARLQSGDLYIGGTSGSDTIEVRRDNGSGPRVFINGVLQGTYNVTGKIVAYGGDGNDDITSQNSNNFDTYMYGGIGNDTLTGGGGDDFLFGGDGADDLNARGGDDVMLGDAGNDDLKGGAGRDILIGGLGADTLLGNADDDILIAGTTSHDQDIAALTSIRNTWLSSGSYASRVSALSAGLLNPDNDVFDDSSVDNVTGGAGTDWFLVNTAGANKDILQDLKKTETASDIDAA